MNNLNLSPEQLDALLKVAGQKLGKNPEDLKKELESGSLDKVISGLDGKSAQKVNSAISNPKVLEAMLSNPQMLNLLSGLLGGKK